jgi:hypothetical protein
MTAWDNFLLLVSLMFLLPLMVLLLNAFYNSLTHKTTKSPRTGFVVRPTARVQRLPVRAARAISVAPLR